MAIKLNFPIWRRAFVHVEACTVSLSGLKDPLRLEDTCHVVISERWCFRRLRHPFSHRSSELSRDKHASAQTPKTAVHADIKA
ncbi:hypothetical protein [Bradyrhizobium guangdongense]|uniref:hypothetical protein n=1 Tax=Bradyrhizobium guangdongense TaxID=1325090 RepID=UPI001319D13B|nr:hypothetical protein [Bradyrhizobium guangdongense]